MIKVVSTVNESVIMDILGVPEIWATVSEGDIEPEEFNIDFEDTIWLLMIKDDTIIGMYNFEALNSVSVEIHAHVLPEYRKQYSKETGTAALRWLFDNVPWAYKVVAQVPEIYPNVSSFVESFGFELEGTNRESWLKDGSLWDVHSYGLTIGELEVAING